jgi:hypothetical protein
VEQGVAHVPLQRPTWPEAQQKPLLQLPEQQSLFPLQVPPLVVQEVTHVLFLQVWPDGQVLPHFPQLLTSLLRSLQLPLQQAGVVPVQVVPQEPQLLVVFRSVHVPLQQPCPEGQGQCAPL